MTTAADARRVAWAWVREVASTLPGYRAAFIAGSLASLPDDTSIPPWSDTDVMVVFDGDAPIKTGKFMRDGVLLEGTSLSRVAYDDPETVLGSYHQAHAIAAGLLVDDPTGWLAHLQQAVRREFARRVWVERRCAAARASVETGLRSLSDGGSLAGRAQSWVFPTGIMTHILLVAGLRNPTVRRRYEAVRDLLAEHGQEPLYERLLEVLGCRALGASRVERHLEAIGAVFDVAAPVEAEGYRFASDVSVLARPISIDGSRDMIARGRHREAVFWLVVTGARALLKLAHGPHPSTAANHENPLRDLLADLGVVTFAGMRERRDTALALLPDVWRAAEEIMAADPRITA